MKREQQRNAVALNPGPVFWRKCTQVMRQDQVGPASWPLSREFISQNCGFRNKPKIYLTFEERGAFGLHETGAVGVVIIQPTQKTSKTILRSVLCHHHIFNNKKMSNREYWKGRIEVRRDIHHEESSEDMGLVFRCHDECGRHTRQEEAKEQGRSKGTWSPWSKTCYQ